MEEHLSARLPAAFIPTHMLQATGKSALISGHFATIPAIAKLLISQEPPWPALFRREQATYHIFQERTPPVHVPQMLYADEQQNVLITTAVQGAIISQDRYPHDISASCAQYLIESAQAIHQWETDQAISPLFNYTERIHKYEGYGWFSGPMATKLR